MKKELIDSVDSIKRYSEGLIQELRKLMTSLGLKNNDIVLFGSIVLGLLGLKKPNDLDVGVKAEAMHHISKKYPYELGSDAEINVGNISFIHEMALPKIQNEKLFDVSNTDYIKGIKVLNLEQWKVMKASDPDTTVNVFVFGEAHYHKDEVDGIRELIRTLNPTYIMLENIEDVQYYSPLINTNITNLEEEYISSGKETLSQQFMIREKRMIENIKRIISKCVNNDIICIQVGDTHLRTLYTKELGINRLRMYLDTLNNVNIIRSNYREIE